MSYGNDRPLPVNPGAGTFQLGERVTWAATARGAHRGGFSGVIVEIVPAGVVPRARGGVPDERLARDHESYVVKAATGRRYWPRVASLSRAPERIESTDHDREFLRQAEAAAGIERPTIADLASTSRRAGGRTSRRRTAQRSSMATDDIATARARRDADKAARRARHIADSQAKAESRRAAAAATCSDALALRTSLRLSLVLASGPTCPTCGTPWRGHTTDLIAHLDAVLGADTTNPGAA